NELVANSGWRLLLMLGALPALLTLFIQFFVPESQRWQQERGRGGTSHWAARDLIGILIGGAAACSVIYLWSPFSTMSFPAQVAGTVVALIVATCGYVYPVMRYLQRRRIAEGITGPSDRVLYRMLLAACLGGIPLLGTWGSIQWAPVWVDNLTSGLQGAKENTQMAYGLGAIV